MIGPIIQLSLDITFLVSIIILVRYNYKTMKENSNWKTFANKLLDEIVESNKQHKITLEKYKEAIEYIRTLRVFYGSTDKL